jgi:hypothetical protein
MHKDGVTEKENFQKEGRYEGGNRRFRKCHIEWRNNRWIKRKRRSGKTEVDGEV